VDGYRRVVAGDFNRVSLRLRRGRGRRASEATLAATELERFARHPKRSRLRRERQRLLRSARSPRRRWRGTARAPDSSQIVRLARQ